MNCKVLGGGVLSVLCVGHRHLLGGTEENREHLLLEWPVSAPTFELVVSRIQIRNFTAGRDGFVCSQWKPNN